jgi:hypothetical protein
MCDKIFGCQHLSIYMVWAIKPSNIQGCGQCANHRKTRQAIVMHGKATHASNTFPLTSIATKPVSHLIEIKVLSA